MEASGHSTPERIWSPFCLFTNPIRRAPGKLAKDKEMQVLYRVRFNQPHWPRVMRESAREGGREAFTGEAMGWVLSGEIGLT